MLTGFLSLGYIPKSAILPPEALSQCVLNQVWRFPLSQHHLRGAQNHPFPQVKLPSLGESVLPLCVAPASTSSPCSLVSLAPTTAPTLAPHLLAAVGTGCRLGPRPAIPTGFRSGPAVREPPGACPPQLTSVTHHCLLEGPLISGLRPSGHTVSPQVSFPDVCPTSLAQAPNLPPGLTRLVLS